MNWINVAPDGTVRECLPEDSTHVSSVLHSRTLLELARVQKELEKEQERNERLYEKHQQTVRQKNKWREQALKAEGEDTRNLTPKKVIIARNGAYWSLRTVDIEASSEEQALRVALDFLKVKQLSERARLNVIKSLGNDEWHVTGHARIGISGQLNPAPNWK